MLILLPPSETKRDGGVGAALDLASLDFGSLTAQRRHAVSRLRALARSRAACIAALKLGPTQHHEVERNRTLTTSATMPAIDRYTGVVFDALEAATLSAEEREFAREHIAVHSALFGLVGALDLIPAYRLSADSRIPDFSLKRHWSAAVSSILRGHNGLILDLRSEGYVALGPLPDSAGAFYLRVVSVGSDGRKRALNHFNKQAKGLLARAVIESGISFGGVEELLHWATGEGFELRRDGEQLELTVPRIEGVPGALRASLR